MKDDDPLKELLAAIDDLIINWATGEDEKKTRERVIKSRRAVGEVRASKEQLLVVLEAQIKSLFQPVINEKRLAEMIGRDRSWFYKERKAGRWLIFELDASGGRYYTPEQILANLRGEKPKAKLKEAV